LQNAFGSVVVMHREAPPLKFIVVYLDGGRVNLRGWLKASAELVSEGLWIGLAHNTRAARSMQRVYYWWQGISRLMS
jgi:hypothetical protein